MVGAYCHFATVNFALLHWCNLHLCIGGFCTFPLVHFALMHWAQLFLRLVILLFSFCSQFQHKVPPTFQYLWCTILSYLLDLYCSFLRVENLPFPTSQMFFLQYRNSYSQNLFPAMLLLSYMSNIFRYRSYCRISYLFLSNSLFAVR